MAKPVIAIDCDDVIIETAPALVTHYNQTYGTRVTLNAIYQDNPLDWGVTDMRTAVERIETYMQGKHYQSIQPSQAAIDAAKRLAQHYTLHVVTSRSGFLAAATRQMLDRYFPDVFASVEFAGYIAGIKHSKADICQKLGATVFIDDHLRYALLTAQHDIKSLLFGDYPWNQAAELPANVVRTRNWAEVEQILGCPLAAE